MTEKKEKTPEEKGVEFVDAVFAGTSHLVEENVKAVKEVSKLGCYVYAIYCVVSFVTSIFVLIVCDLLKVIPAWLMIVVGIIIVGLVIYASTRKPESPDRT